MISPLLFMKTFTISCRALLACEEGLRFPAAAQGFLLGGLSASKRFFDISTVVHEPQGVVAPAVRHLPAHRCRNETKLLELVSVASASRSSTHCNLVARADTIEPGCCHNGARSTASGSSPLHVLRPTMQLFLRCDRPRARIARTTTPAARSCLDRLHERRLFRRSARS